MTQPATPVYVSPRVETLYERYAQAHAGEIDTRALAMHFWQMGGQDMMAQMVQFNDFVPRLRALERRLAEMGDVFAAVQRGHQESV